MPIERPPFGAVFVCGASMPRMLRFYPFLFVALAAALLGGCSRPAFELGGETQGTTYHLAIVADRDDIGRMRLQALIDRRLAEIDRALSNYREDSELSRFNAAPVGEWLPLGADLYQVLLRAQAVSAQSDGAFDVTVAPLIELWGFGPGGRRDALPDAAAIAAARAGVDWRQLQLDATSPRARKQAALRIDVNGIAQGYTVDALATLLATEGYRDFLVEVGGELRLSGVNAAGKKWRIGIERPGDGVGPVEQGVSGADVGITTAGDYHDYFERDGVRYSHTVDPATGRPVTHRLASVTVIASDATYADGMDTALEVLGPDRGYQLAERLKIAAYFIVRSNNGFSVRYTPEMRQYLLSQ
jgi:thiamine biosynthesis lipoprotein